MRELSAKKPCEYGKYGLFEHLFFLLNWNNQILGMASQSQHSHLVAASASTPGQAQCVANTLLQPVLAHQDRHSVLPTQSQHSHCNGPRVVQRKDRQKKEFHDQSDYRQWCMLLMSSTNLSSHTRRHNKQFFSQCSGERQNIFEKLQYHPAPHTPNGNIHPHISSFIHYSFR